MSKDESGNPILLTFTFDLVGDGQKILAGKFEAEDLERAVRDARKLCKRLALPGWNLVCRENGKAFNAVQFIDYEHEKKKEYR